MSRWSEGHQDEAALDVAAALLGTGKTSRLYRKLVLDERMALDVATSHDPGRYPGWFGINIVLIPGQDRAKAELLVLEELRKLGLEPASEADVARCQRLLLSHTVFERESVHGLADGVTRKVINQPAAALKDELVRWAAVTPAGVQRVAKQYLNPEQPVVVWSVPPTAKPGAGAMRSASSATTTASAAKPLSGRRAGEAAVVAADAEGPVAQRIDTVTYGEPPPADRCGGGIAEVGAAAMSPRQKSGLAQLTGSLYEEGTPKRTGPQISETIEALGGSLVLSARGGSVKVLTEDRKVGLDILFDCLLHPSFPAEAFGRKKQEQLADIAEAMEQPDVRGAELFNELIYSGHYLGRSSRGKIETVEKLTREDCAAFHQQIVVPENVTVAIVGDFDPKEMVDEITRLTAGWEGKLPPSPKQAVGLREAIKMLEEEGLENVFARHKRHSAATRAAVKAWGLENPVPGSECAFARADRCSRARGP